MSLITHLAKLQAEVFVKNNEAYMKCLPVLDVPQTILLGYYDSIVSSGKIIVFEKMEKADQIGVWEMAKEFSAGRIPNNEGMRRLCKCLIAIEYILSQ